MGETCTFTESGTSISKFCENGCCDNSCCSETSVDTKALAIALAVILGILLLIALIILIIYCCLKRSKRGKNKTDWRHKDMALTEMQSSKDRNRNLQNGRPGGYFGPVHKIHRLIQTGDPNPDPRDHILWGRARRWSTNTNSKSRPPRNTWNRSIMPMENFSQTSDDDTSRYQQIIPQANRSEAQIQTSSIDQSPFHGEVVEYQEKGIQTPAPKSNLNDPNRATRDRNKQYLPSWTPTAPWRPSAQLKSLSKNTPAPVNTGTNNVPKEIEPFYSVHRCPPNSSFESEQSGNQSVTHRSNEVDINS